MANIWNLPESASGPFGLPDWAKDQIPAGWGVTGDPSRGFEVTGPGPFGSTVGGSVDWGSYPGTNLFDINVDSQNYRLGTPLSAGGLLGGFSFRDSDPMKGAYIHNTDGNRIGDGTWGNARVGGGVSKFIGGENAPYMTIDGNRPGLYFNAGIQPDFLPGLNITAGTNKFGQNISNLDYGKAFPIGTGSARFGATIPLPGNEQPSTYGASFNHPVNIGPWTGQFKFDVGSEGGVKATIGGPYENLMRGLEGIFGPPPSDGIPLTGPSPGHFTIPIGSDYDIQTLEKSLDDIERETRPDNVFELKPDSMASNVENPWQRNTEVVESLAPKWEGTDPEVRAKFIADLEQREVERVQAEQMAQAVAEAAKAEQARAAARAAQSQRAKEQAVVTRNQPDRGLQQAQAQVAEAQRVADIVTRASTIPVDPGLKKTSAPKKTAKKTTKITRPVLTPDRKPHVPNIVWVGGLNGGPVDLNNPSMGNIAGPDRWGGGIGALGAGSGMGPGAGSGNHPGLR